MFQEDSPPHRSDIPQLLHLCATTREPRAFALLMEQWDFTLDSTGDGAAIVDAFPPEAWRNAPGTLKHLLAVPQPNPDISDVIVCLTDAIACLSGPRAQPSSLSISCLLERYGDWSETPVLAFPQAMLELMAVKHTPFQPRVHGLPWHYDLSPLVRPPLLVGFGCYRPHQRLNMSV